MSAINLNTGEYGWQIPLGEYPELAENGTKNTGTENYGGPIVTAGGLVFTALQDGWVVAYNDDTLEELWRFNVGTALKGAPVTYMIGTKQYVAVQTSGRHLHPVKFDNFQDSSYMFVFALN